MVKVISDEVLKLKKLVLHTDFILSNSSSCVSCIGITLDSKIVGYRFICSGYIDGHVVTKYLDISLNTMQLLRISNLPTNAFIKGVLSDEGVVKSDSELAEKIKVVDVSEDRDLCLALIKRVGGL